MTELTTTTPPLYKLAAATALSLTLPVLLPLLFASRLLARWLLCTASPPRVTPSHNQQCMWVAKPALAPVHWHWVPVQRLQRQRGLTEPATPQRKELWASLRWAWSLSPFSRPRAQVCQVTAPQTLHAAMAHSHQHHRWYNRQHQDLQVLQCPMQWHCRQHTTRRGCTPQACACSCDLWSLWPARLGLPYSTFALSTSCHQCTSRWSCWVRYRRCADLCRLHHSRGALTQCHICPYTSRATATTRICLAPYCHSVLWQPSSLATSPIGGVSRPLCAACAAAVPSQTFCALQRHWPRNPWRLLPLPCSEAACSQPQPATWPRTSGTTRPPPHVCAVT